MVETWRDSWFEEGARLIYIMPSNSVNRILPLRVDPTPSQTARVFVGRIELVTPDVIRSVEEAVAKRDWPTIERYRRFLEPTLQRTEPASLESANRARQLLQQVDDSAGTTRCQ